ncbi:Lipase_GDSL domain-containing protein, partial [Cephalotus follicularis]
MEGEIRLRLVVYVLLLVSGLQHFGNGEPQVPCYFIFGDSLVDDGNNNDIDTRAKCNYPPYGIDFPSGPNATGRFTNSLTAADIIAELLGFENYIPPFAMTKDPNVDILSGVNYASGASGIRDETGQQSGTVISLNKQLLNHQITVERIKLMLGDNSTAYLNKCLYSVGMGSNDYINNYFMPQYYPTSHRYNQTQYADVLIQQYSQQIRTLYNYGARKIALIGVGLIGCTPNAIATYGTNSSLCVDVMNNASLTFNEKLKLLVDQLSNTLTDAKFIYINSLGISASINVTAAGFTITNHGCCNITKYGLCDPYQSPCPNRSQYVFWDAFHPTEAVNNITVTRWYSAADPSDAHPMDISEKKTMLMCVCIYGDLNWLISLLLVVSSLQQCVHGKPQVPCFFIFGDSLADNGNNNKLKTLAEVNYPPYGIDFPDGPTGRFTNGRTAVDIIAQLLGFVKFITPFATSKNSDILRGVNYASGSAGIRDESGQQLGENICLNKQLQHHKTIVARIAKLLGNPDLASKHLNQCLYSVGMGSNDYINNYYMPQYYPTSKQYTVEEYAHVLLQQYSQQLKSLYNYGSRKVMVNPLGLIGCTPNAIALYGKNKTICVGDMNNAAQRFNEGLESLLDQLNTNLTDAKFITTGPSALASLYTGNLCFKFTIKGCCKVNNVGQCIPDKAPCKNRNTHLFWDSFHPTE